MGDAGAVLVCAIEAAAPTPAETAFYQRVAPSGLTLFTRNLTEPHAELTQRMAAFQRLRPPGAPPLVVAIDQEGGRVARLKAPFPNAGPAMNLAGGETAPAALISIAETAKDLGARLRELGVNVNFAPVLDVLSEPTNTAIGDRSFGTTPEAVRLRAGAFLEGLEASGVAGCLKHFPGQGAAKVDTHVGAAVVDADRALLDARDIAPFRALMAKARLVMISHCIFPALAPEEAGRAPRVLQGLLRGELRYDGVIVSDDLNMGALPQDQKLWQEALVDAVVAGTDMLLVCRHLERFELAYEALAREAAKSRAFATRLADAARRVMKFRTTL